MLRKMRNWAKESGTPLHQDKFSPTTEELNQIAEGARKIETQRDLADLVKYVTKYGRDYNGFPAEMFWPAEGTKFVFAEKLMLGLSRTNEKRGKLQYAALGPQLWVARNGEMISKIKVAI